MNYFVVNAPSNLIVGVVSTSYTPVSTKTQKFIEATEEALDRYYAFLDSEPDMCPDVGEYMKQTSYIFD